MRESIQAFLLHPEIPVPLLCIGVLLICLEFCRPGRVIYGCLGGLLAMSGFYGLGQPHTLAMWESGLLAFTLLIVAGLLWIARRARRAKRTQVAIHQRNG